MINTDFNGLWEKAHGNDCYLYSDDRFIRNNVLYSLPFQEKIRLFHITTNENYRRIQETKQIFASGGCLVAGIYCTPIVKDGQKLRLHNLGSYYLKEFSSCENNAQGLIIEIENKTRKAMLRGLNYLNLGKIHYNYYAKDKDKLNVHYRLKLEERVFKCIKESKEFIARTFELKGKSISYHESIEYINRLNMTSKTLPIIGYSIFEALSKFIMWNQNDSLSNYFKDLNEIYNWNYKDMFFEMFPFLSQSFDIQRINLDIDNVSTYISQHQIISHFDKNKFVKDITESIIDILHSYFFENLDKNSVDDFLCGKKYAAMENLEGHLYNRFLKQERMIVYSNTIELNMAKDIWRFWTSHETLLIYNSGTPKGELCINPVFLEDFTYSVYNCKFHKFNYPSALVYVEKQDRLNVQISPSVITYNDSSHR